MLISAEEARRLCSPAYQLDDAISMLSSSIENAAKNGLYEIKVFAFGFDSIKSSVHDLCTPLQASIIDSLKEKGYNCYLDSRGISFEREEGSFLLVSWSN